MATSCTRPSPSIARPTPTPTKSPTFTGNRQPDWESLRGKLLGRLVTPRDRDYETLRLSANPRFDDLRPVAVARCASAADVVAAVRFARDGAVPFAVRSGGHCYAGWSTGTGLVIDTSPMGAISTAISTANRTVTVGAGTRLIDLYRAAARAGLGVPAGSCRSVGATGLTLGGGVGVMTRVWGLTCDALTELEIVTADGTVLTVNSGSEPELFWASRGGGGGSFGIVTRLSYRAHPAPALSLITLTWPWSRAAEVVAAWQAWAPSTDRRMWTTCKLLARGSSPRVLVAGVWAGPEAGATPALSGLLTGVGSAPSTTSIRRHPYLAAMLIEGGAAGREPLAATSHIPATALPVAGVQALVAAVAGLAQDGALRAAGLVETGVSLDALGGAVADQAPDATAFGHRTAPFTMQYTATWRPGRPADPFVAAARGLRGRMLPFAGAGAYVNYCDSDIANWQDAYWGDNRWRLSRAKHRYDPDGVFTFPQAVQG